MATAAPSAGEAAPQPQPAPDGGETQGGGAAGGSQGAQPANPAAIENAEATGQDGIETDAVLTQSKKIKPIKPLPGVMDEGPIEAVDKALEARQRDERGRFLPKDAVSGTGKEAPPEPKATPPEPTGEVVAPEPPVDPNAPKKFVFAGKEWDSPEAAEQNYKSLQGQFKPLIEDRNKAAYSANAWHETAQGLQAEVQRLTAELEAARSAQPQSQPAEQQTTGEAPTEIDWELFAEIKKAADAEGNPWKADQWLQKQQAKVWAAREAALREELTAPFKQAQERQETLNHVSNLASELAEYVNDSDGQPSFPELRDKQSAFMVGKLWSELWKDSGLPKETIAKLAQTHVGMIAAIGLYRMANQKQDAQPPASQGPETVATPAPPNPAAAAAALAGGRPEPMPSVAESSMDPRAAALVKGLSNTKLTRKGLGFAE